MDNRVSRWFSLHQTVITRWIAIIAAVGTVVFILLGLLQPASSQPLLQPVATAANNVGNQEGKQAPNFTLVSVDGKKISLSDFRGQAVMLNFWHIDCEGCQIEIPGLQKVYSQAQHTQKNFVVLGVNVVDESSAIKAFVQRKELTYPIVLDQNLSVNGLYNVNATPTSFFIDRVGTIRTVRVGPVAEDELWKQINSLSA